MASSAAPASVLMNLLIISNMFFSLFASSSPYGCAPAGYERFSSPYVENDNKDISMQFNNRKIMMGWGGSPKTKTEEKEMKERVEMMREVPSGPDPLHHNAGPHRRPSISP